MKPWPIPWRSLVYRTMLFSVIFVAAMIGTNIACLVVWQNTIADRVYSNIDDDGGYLESGAWVGSNGTRPVITVKQIVLPSLMGDSDEIKAGWSIRRLLVLWWCMFSSTVILSTWFGLLPWFNLVSVLRRMPRFGKIALAALILGPLCACWFLG